MPHKRNPITTERLTGLARVLRGYASTAVEDVVHEDRMLENLDLS